MDKCACRGSFLERFLQPTILMLLNQEKLHGFSILKKLSESEIMDYSGIDPTGLYRTLKKMESSGLLLSNWDIENSSPPRRMYEITDDGRDCLLYWKKTLLEYQISVSKLAQAVANSLNNEKLEQ